MNRRFRRNLLVSSAVHLALVVLMVLIPALLNWRVRRKPHELITYVDLQPPTPEPAAVAPAPAPPPPPPRQEIPEPPKEPAKKKPIEKSTRRVPPPATPPPKPLSAEEIRKLLEAGTRPPRSSALANTDALPAWYYALVRQTMYDAWAQPGGLSASAGLVTRVEIRVERGGGISRRTLVKPSGNRLMDESVMKAVNSVAQLPPLPPQFPGAYKDITIDFELTREAP